MDFTLALSANKGEIKAVKQTTPASRNNLIISEIRRRFSDLPSGEKLKSAQRPCLTLSPSNTYEKYPLLNSAYSRPCAMVDLPDEDNPVNQNTFAFWWKKYSRSFLDISPRKGTTVVLFIELKWSACTGPGFLGQFGCGSEGNL